MWLGRVLPDMAVLGLVDGLVAAAPFGRGAAAAMSLPDAGYCSAGLAASGRCCEQPWEEGVVLLTGAGDASTADFQDDGREDCHFVHGQERMERVQVFMENLDLIESMARSLAG